MNSKIIIGPVQEHRIRPKNLVEKDIKLFEHEFSLALPEVHRTELKNVSILRNVIFSLHTLKFYKSFTNIYITPKKYFFKMLRLFLTVPQYTENGIWITDEISSEYFHWFTDALSRLKAIESSYTDSYDLKKKFPIVLPDFYRNKPYIGDSLQILGYTPIYYNTKRRLQVATLLSCAHPAPTGNYNSEVIRCINESLTLNHELVSTRKIYISRAKALKRKVLNEDEVIQLLLKNNFEIHVFEDYTYHKQLEIMSSTKTMVGLHGAGLTNMLFMNKGGQVLELRNANDSHNNCYFSLSSSLKHDYYYLNCKGDREDTNAVNITVNLSDLEKAINQLSTT